MARIEARRPALGWVLPPPITPPPGMRLPFEFVRLAGARAFIAGHGPQSAEGPFAQPLGKLGRELLAGRVISLRTSRHCPSRAA